MHSKFSGVKSAINRIKSATFRGSYRPLGERSIDQVPPLIYVPQAYRSDAYFLANGQCEKNHWYVRDHSIWQYMPTEYRGIADTATISPDRSSFATNTVYYRGLKTTSKYQPATYEVSGSLDSDIGLPEARRRILKQQPSYKRCDDNVSNEYPGNIQKRVRKVIAIYVNKSKEAIVCPSWLPVYADVIGYILCYVLTISERPIYRHISGLWRYHQQSWGQLILLVPRSKWIVYIPWRRCDWEWALDVVDGPSSGPSKLMICPLPLRKCERNLECDFVCSSWASWSSFPGRFGWRER